MTTKTAQTIQTAASIIGTRSATSVTRRLVTLAIAGDLRPHISSDGIRHGLYRVYLNGHGSDALFGALDISARNGNLVRAYLTQGNSGREARVEKVATVRAILGSAAR